MAIDKQRIAEQAQRILARRQTSLKDTLEEIALLEAAGAPPQAIQAARVKRDRQHNACKASEQLIAILGGESLLTKKGR